MMHDIKTFLFDQWTTLEDDNIATEMIKESVVDMPQRMLLATHELEDYDKLIFMSQSVQMVLGGLKPVASMLFYRSLLKTYQEQGLLTSFDIHRLHKVFFDYFNLRVVETLQGRDDQISLYVYNPKALEVLHQSFEGFLPFGEFDSLHTWMEACVQQGLQKDFVLGILFGFPTSAVKQYAQYMGNESCRYEGRQLISNYGESYYVWGSELKRDVKIREAYKERFFTLLASEPLYRQMRQELVVTAEPFRAVSQDLFEKTIYSLKVQRDLH